MSTVFIAVQCFQCSTMQVKQRKKSSNKWSCVVCNEKQSVRKVFSQGFMAKDVRKFVQSFNMSRQFIEQQQELREETLVQEQIENQSIKKRTDWSEYIDPDIYDTGFGDEQGELCEPNVVTELPKPLFKKPKLRDNYSATGLDSEDGEKLRRPVFGKRNVNKKISNPGKEHKTTVRETFKSASDTVDHGFTFTGSSSVMAKLNRPVSKWNNFINDDDDDDNDLQLESRCQEINPTAFETKVSDEIVEDDVHPDFL